MTQEITLATPNVPAIHEHAFSAENLKRNVDIVRSCMEAVMRPNHHYGKIPGCGDKPALLKPGAEVLSMAFRFAPTFSVDQTDMGNGHREYSVTCSLAHGPTGGYIGQGLGSCSTMEGKYRFRKAERSCPECGQEAIIKGKPEYGGGWLCYAKKGGCGAKFQAGDDAIEAQVVGQVEQGNPADYYNTCLKMAKKRAFVDAILTCTAASDVFTQDIEENPELFGGRPQTYGGKPAQITPRRQAKAAAPPEPAPPLGAMKAQLQTCMTVDDLNTVFKSFNLAKDHPDYESVVEECRNVKDMIMTAGASKDSDIF